MNNMPMLTDDKVKDIINNTAIQIMNDFSGACLEKSPDSDAFGELGLLERNFKTQMNTFLQYGRTNLEQILRVISSEDTDIRGLLLVLRNIDGIPIDEALDVFWQKTEYLYKKEEERCAVEKTGEPNGYVLRNYVAGLINSVSYFPNGWRDFDFRTTCDNIAKYNNALYDSRNGVDRDSKKLIWWQLRRISNYTPEFVESCLKFLDFRKADREKNFHWRNAHKQDYLDWFYDDDGELSFSSQEVFGKIKDSLLTLSQEDRLKFFSYDWFLDNGLDGSTTMPELFYIVQTYLFPVFFSEENNLDNTTDESKNGAVQKVKKPNE